MKKAILIVSIITAIAWILPACSGNSTKNIENTIPEKLIYACPMHLEVTSDKPGECRICGMDLEKQESTGTQPDSSVNNN